MREPGGGMVNSLLTHHIDLLRFTFGDLHEVDGAVATLIREKPVLPWDYRDGDPLGPDTETIGMRAVDGDDAAVIGGVLDGGAPFVLSGSWSIRNGTGVRVGAYGTDGTLVLAPEGPEGRVGRRRARRRRHAGRPAIALPRGGSPLVALFAMLAEDVAAAVAGKPPPHGAEHVFASLDDAWRVQEVVDRVLRARPS